ncbi:hypothetical protein YSY43_46360 [Paenibacillus sp. YSY-4.3]
MSLFFMILRKMIQNKWLVFSLFLGIFMTAGLVSAIPIYSEAILSRMLVKELETVQTSTNTYPGIHLTKVSFQKETADKRKASILELNEYMRDAENKGFGIPVTQLVVELQTSSMQVVPEAAGQETPGSKQLAALKSLSDFEAHIRLIDGDMPSEAPVDGVFEVLVNQKTMTSLDFVLGSVFQLRDSQGNVVTKVKPVGVYQKKEDNDLYFRSPQLDNLDRVFVVPETTFERYFINDNALPVSSAWWYFVFDYSKMELRNIDDFLGMSEKVQAKAKNVTSQYQTDVTVPAVDIIKDYFGRTKHLLRLMWSLNVPVLFMLGFYMFMVSNLIVDRQKSEIAVLRSRGASRFQIMTSYAVEASILCCIAWLIGPFLGLFLTKVLGASNGFLEFVQRSRLPVYVNIQSYQYSGFAVLGSFLMILLPVYFATRVSIVGHKQKVSRVDKQPFWHKIFLDVLLLAVSIYGLYAFNSRIKAMASLGLTFDDLQMDPLQFVVPALFIVGGGMFVLRLYPLVLKLIYRLGRSLWPPSWYITLIQVGRSSSQYQFLMIFFIITIATGVFSAGAARTINNNTEERIKYSGGSDFILKSEWPSNKPVVTPAAMYGQQESASTTAAPTPSIKVIQYEEPPFEPFLALPGVESAAKVFVKEQADFQVGEARGSAKLIGIDTDDFGHTTWFQDLLLSNSLNEHLNVIAGDSRAIIISRTLAEQKQAKVGDTIWIGWTGVDQQPFIVYSIVDYFPTFNPNPAVRSEDKSSSQAEEDNRDAPMLIVGHLSRIQLQLALEPYEVWLKMDADTSTADFYTAIEQAKLNIVDIHNTRQELIKAKNDPFLMAVNGILTLGFLNSILITFVGFLLYWILSLRGRVLQNGVMRALGVSLRQLVGMLVIEQVLTSGTAIMIGIWVGNITSRLFVPNFQIAFNPGTLVPPFRVVFEHTDFIRIYIVIGIMLAIGLAILGYMLSRIRIHQALKLGED